MQPSELLAKYDAILKNVTFSNYGYWQVTYNCAPGLDMTITVCENGIDSTRAAELAAITLQHQTGQKVRE